MSTTTQEIKAIPAPTNIRGAEYPRILPDLRVEFRIIQIEAEASAFKPL